MGELVTAYFLSPLILSTLMMSAIRSSETSVPTRATWRNIPETAFFLFVKIWGFHGGDYEEWRFLGCYALLFICLA
jgi:hypothetical protein